MYTCIIIDDDIFSIKILQQLLLGENNLRCVKYFTDPLEGIKYLEENTVDVLFLDIQMPKMNGFELKEKLKKEVEIICITAYKEFALEAYNNNISGYLVKPISIKRLNQAVEKIMQTLASKKNFQSINENFSSDTNSIIIKYKNKSHRLFLNDILYVESKSEYVCYNTKADSIIDYERLKNIEKKLPKETFIRIHKSYIVNKKLIKSYNNFFVKLITDQDLPVGKVYRDKFKTEFIEARDKTS
jgi:DNA-binding LytR/AlgR family response regulator